MIVPFIAFSARCARYSEWAYTPRDNMRKPMSTKCAKTCAHFNFILKSACAEMRKWDASEAVWRAVDVWQKFRAQDTKKGQRNVSNNYERPYWTCVKVSSRLSRSRRKSYERVAKSIKMLPRGKVMFPLYSTLLRLYSIRNIGWAWSVKNGKNFRRSCE